MLENLVAIAEEAGRCALDYFEQRSTLPVTSKAHLNLVTEADRAVEKLIARRLRETFPEDGIFGEEGENEPGQSGRIWVVDPIDGTFNFVRGGKQWAVSIGLFEDSRPVRGVVHAPVSSTMLVGGADFSPLLNGKSIPPLPPFLPERGAIAVGFDTGTSSTDQLAVLRFLMDEAKLMIRSCNCATMAMLEVVSGDADAYLAMGDSSWDVLGAWPVLEALGGKATFDWSGVPLTSKLHFAIGKPGAVECVAGLFEKQLGLSPRIPGCHGA